MEIRDIINASTFINLSDVLEELSLEEVIYLDFYVFGESRDLIPDSMRERFNEISFDEFIPVYKKFNSCMKINPKKEQLKLKILQRLESNVISMNKIVITGQKDLFYSKLCEVIFLRIKKNCDVTSLSSLEEYIKKTFFKNIKKSNVTIAIISLKLCFEVADFLQEDFEGQKNKFIFTVLKALLLNINGVMAKNVAFLASYDKKRDRELNKTLKELQKLKDTNSKLREAKVKLMNDFATLEKSQEDKNNYISDIIDNINNRFNEMKDTNKNLIKEVKEVKASADVTAYKNEVDRLTTQIGDLKATLREKTKEIKELEKQLEEFQNNKSIAPNKEICDVAVTSISKELKNEKEDKKRFDVHTSRIGYVTVENNIHYINFTDNILPVKHEIFNLPNNLFFHKNQFIKVDEKYNFVFAYSSVIEDTTRDLSNLQLACVDNIPATGNSICVTAHEKSFLADSNGRKERFKINTIVGLDKMDRVVITFKSPRLTADSLIDSIKARNYDIYYVIKVLGDNFIMRNIIKNRDVITTLKCNDERIDERWIVIVDGDTIVKGINSPRFYNNSSFYDKSKLELAVIEIHNDNTLAKKVNTGETILMNNLPIGLHFSGGEVINLDEFNNYSHVVDDKALIEKVTTTKKSSNQKISDGINPDIKGKILILGNPRFQSNYKNAFIKEGYEATTVDGIMRSPAEIERACKDMDYVVCVKNHTSHENFWFVKDTLPNSYKKVYTPLSVDGANRIVDMVLNYNKYYNA